MTCELEFTNAVAAFLVFGVPGMVGFLGLAAALARKVWLEAAR